MENSISHAGKDPTPLPPPCTARNIRQRRFYMMRLGMYVTYITGQAAWRSNNIGQSRFCFSLLACGTKPSMQQRHKASFIRKEAGTVISLRSGRQRVHGPTSSSRKRLCLLQSVQNGAEAQPAPFSIGAGGFPSQVQRPECVRYMIIQLHLVPRVKT